MVTGLIDWTNEGWNGRLNASWMSHWMANWIAKWLGICNGQFNGQLNSQLSWKVNSMQKVKFASQHMKSPEMKPKLLLGWKQTSHIEHTCKLWILLRSLFSLILIGLLVLRVKVVSQVGWPVIRELLKNGLSFFHIILEGEDLPFDDLNLPEVFALLILIAKWPYLVFCANFKTDPKLTLSMDLTSNLC